MTAAANGAPALPDPADPRAPKYWKHETSGVVALAVGAFLRAPEALTNDEIAVMRAYVTQWIDSPAWDMNPHDGDYGRAVLAALRRSARTIATPRDLMVWLTIATREGFNPL